MAEKKYKVRMRRPNTLIVRSENGDARVDIPSKDQNEMDSTVASVILSVARDWVKCGVAEAIDPLPPEKEPAAS